MKLRGNPNAPSSCPDKVWQHKNPEVKLKMLHDGCMSESEWKESNFPSHAIAPKISTPVKCEVWKNSLERMSEGSQCRGHIDLMQKVLVNLTEGCDSKVGPPWDSPTVCTNIFPDPPINLPWLQKSKQAIWQSPSPLAQSPMQRSMD